MTHTDPAIAAIILAAGESSRFGSPKQLLDWEGRPLVAHIAGTAWVAGLDPVVVVTGASAERIVPILHSWPVQIVHNYRWRHGLSSSINVGLSALPPNVEAALFIPIDQPLITPHLLQQLIDRWRTTGAGIVVPETSTGQHSTPVLFEQRFFPELACLTGDIGGRALFERHRNCIAPLRVSESWMLMDIDTQEAYRQVQEYRKMHSAQLTLDQIRGVICDMDGVLWRSQQPLPGLTEFFALIDELGLAYTLVTNNSSRTPQQYVEKLAHMGVQTHTEHVLNSAIAAAHYIAEQGQRNTMVYAIGGPGVHQALESYGLKHTHRSDIDAADFVLVGWDQKLTWTKLATATRLILDGATFVSTNPDLTFPMERWLAPGNGAQIAALEAATGVTAITVGKPAPPLYQQAMTQMGTTPTNTLVIGDRLDTDILGGARLGMPTALLLTGVSNRDELKHSPIHPTAIFENLPAMIQAWRGAHEGVSSY